MDRMKGKVLFFRLERGWECRKETSPRREESCVSPPLFLSFSPFFFSFLPSFLLSSLHSFLLSFPSAGWIGGGMFRPAAAAVLPSSVTVKEVSASCFSCHRRPASSCLHFFFCPFPFSQVMIPLFLCASRDCTGQER